MNKKIIAGGIATFVLGLVIGGAGTSDAAAKPTSVTVPGPTKTITKTVTHTVSKTPQACLDALDLTAQLSSIISEQDQAFADAANQAAQDGDIETFLHSQSDALNTATAKVSDLTPQMATASAGCRAGS